MRWILALGSVFLMGSAALARDDAAQRKLIEAIRTGDAPAVSEALKAGGDPSGPGGRAADTATELALMYGDPAVVEALMQHGADLKSLKVGGWNALELMLLEERPSAESVKRLIDQGLKARTRVMGQPALATRASVRSPAVMRALLDAGYDPSEKSAGFTPLVHAVLWGSPECVKALIDAGASVRQPLIAGREAAHWVGGRCGPECAAIIKILKDAGADLEARDGEDWTPLQVAVTRGCPEAVAALIDAGAKVNGRDGAAPLVMAAEYGNASIVKVLLEKGAKPNVQDEQGRSALVWALVGGEPVMRWKWRGHSTASATGETVREMLTIIDRADPEGMVEALLKAGADPNEADDDWSPLDYAAYEWNIRNVRRLSTAKGDSDEGDGDRGLGNDQEVRSFYERHDPVKLVKMLIAAGAKRRSGGDTLDALDIAARRGDDRARAVIEALRGAKVERLGPEPLKPDRGGRNRGGME